MPLDPISPSEYPTDVVWDAIQTLLAASLTGVDVAATGEKDFDDNGNLILSPPSVRGLYAGEMAEGKDNQNISYDVDQNYEILCADQDYTADNHGQRRKSAQLAAHVKHILIGARLKIANATDDSPEILTEPVRYIGMQPLPVADLGTAFVVLVAVPGIAQFAAPNA